MYIKKRCDDAEEGSARFCSTGSFFNTNEAIVMIENQAILCLKNADFGDFGVTRTKSTLR